MTRSIRADLRDTEICRLKGLVSIVAIRVEIALAVAAITPGVACSNTFTDLESDENQVEDDDDSDDPDDSDDSDSPDDDEQRCAAVSLRAPLEVNNTSQSTQSDSATDFASCPDILTFADPIVEAAVRTSVGLAKSAPIRAEDVKDLYRLSLNGIHQLKGLECLPHLNDLSINDSEISDLPEISKLGIYDLQITRSSIRDLNPISKIYNLQRLHLDNNQITDLSPLVELSNLQNLDVSSNCLKDVPPLTSFKHLKYFSVNDNQLTQLDFLNGIETLDHLALRDNRLVDVSQVPRGLHYLDLSENHIEHIDRALLYDPRSDEDGGGGYIDLSSNAIRDIRGLTPSTERVHVQVLDFRDNPLDCDDLLQTNAINALRKNVDCYPPGGEAPLPRSFEIECFVRWDCDDIDGGDRTPTEE